MKEPIVDHLGNVFPTKKKMCEAWGIKPDTFYSRIKYKGWSLEKALTTKDDSRIECVGIDGEIFSSVSELCEKYGISRHIYDNRIKNGWTIEDIIKTESLVGIKCVDHEGRHFSSIKEMCDFHGVSRAKYQHRIDIGMSLEDALKKEDYSIKRVRIDHKGIEYPSFVKMCEAYGANSYTVVDRLERNWTLEEALTGNRDRIPAGSKKCMDFKGIEYPNKASMCRAYGVDYKIFRRRLSLGWSLQEALTQRDNPIKPNSKACKDHLGKEFVSRVEMCKFWNITPDILKGRLSDGWSLEEALTIPRMYSLGEYRVSQVLLEYEEKKIIDGFYHDITIKKAFDYLGLKSQYKEFIDAYEIALKDCGINVSKQKFSKFRFDFTIIKNKEIFAFVEFDGAQHFEFVDLFFKTLENFILRHKADLAKDAFAEINNIPLLRIRYDQVEETKIRYMLTDLLNNPNKYIYQHNTYLTNEEYMAVFEGKTRVDFVKPLLGYS